MSSVIDLRTFNRMDECKSVKVSFVKNTPQEVVDYFVNFFNNLSDIKEVVELDCLEEFRKKMLYDLQFKLKNSKVKINKSQNVRSE
jgi:hypothetical protein